MQKKSQKLSKIILCLYRLHPVTPTDLGVAGQKITIVFLSTYFHIFYHTQKRTTKIISYLDRLHPVPATEDSARSRGRDLYRYDHHLSVYRL